MTYRTPQTHENAFSPYQRILDQNMYRHEDYITNRRAPSSRNAVCRYIRRMIFRYRKWQITRRWHKVD